jgi:2-polyprenyl-3-methyl-5-hydroxy-6-metoxy-1,4-benzoquinol methylase
MTCPVCSETRSTLVKGTAGGDYARCAGCGTEFSLTDDAEASYANAQANFFHDDDLLGSPVVMEARRDAAHRRLNRIRGSLSPGSLLEIGPGSGLFMVEAKRAGFKVEGVDEAPHMAEVASAASGGKVHVGRLESIPVDESFDNVVSFHVIEHVPDPLAHLRSMRKVVREGGKCAIITPNVSSWQHRLLGPRSASYSTAHLILYSPESLSKIMAATGWEVVRSGTIDHPSEWIRTLRRLLRRGPLSGSGGGGASAKGIRMLRIFSALSSPIRWVQDKLRRGDEIVIMARAI